MDSNQNENEKSLRRASSSADAHSEELRLRRQTWLFDELNATAKGLQSHIEAEGLLAIVRALLKRGHSDEEILRGLERCMAEIKPVNGYVAFNLAVLLEKMSVVEGEDRTKAEALNAWSRIAKTFYIAPGCDYHSVLDGKLERILADSSERVRHAFFLAGGRDVVVHTPIGDLHFVQSRFFDAYERGEQCEELNKLPPAGSEEAKALQDLVASAPRLPAVRRQVTQQEKAEARAEAAAWAESRRSPRSDVRNSREKLEAQLAELRARRGEGK